MLNFLAEDLQQMTPMIRQVFELKQKAPDAILFFRMGDFYEIFGQDAELVAPLLELVLTSRERGDKQRIPFCGVPHHCVKGYWSKLLRLGFRVAIADQIEDPAEAKGLVRRDIVQILTPGSIDELDGLDADQPNYLLGLHENPGDKTWILAALDISTGEFRLGRIERSELGGWLEILQAKEVVARKFLHDEIKQLLSPYLSRGPLSFGVLSESILRDADEQRRILHEQFSCGHTDEMPCGKIIGAQALAAAMLRYLKDLHAGTGQFLSIRALRESDRMQLDETVRRDLELFETARRREVEGSLFKEINATRTPMGARLLRYDLARPFLNPQRILERQEAVQQILKSGLEQQSALQTILKSCADLERLTTRVLAFKAQAADLLQIRASLSASLQLSTLLRSQNLDGLLGLIAEKLQLAQDILAPLQAALLPDPAALGSLDIFAEGFDLELDRLRQLSRHGQDQIDSYEQKLRQETGINSLKIKEHKSYGLLIEITKANLAKVPSGFIRRQTMVNNERFVTLQLEELGEILALATEEAVARELALFQELLRDLSLRQESLRDVSEALALLDLLQGFAVKARQENYCRPELSSNGDLRLLACRHPVVERWVGTHAFMPNDVELLRGRSQLLITGPNMAGKSTVMRQTALAAILHQIGSFVPARAASLPLFDQIFTRVGAADDLSRGQSTFMVEMSEAANILRLATDRSLVILDEVGRGTSTEDGLAIAAAIIEHIAKKLRCYTLFATHYHELVPFSKGLASVRTAQVEVLEERDSIRFTHRLIEGASGSSFGVDVAKIAGIPESIIARARLLMAQPELFNSTQKRSPVAKNLAPPSLEAAFVMEPPAMPRSLDPQLRQLKERLERVNIHKTTPIQALNILDEMKAYLTQTEQGSLFPEASSLC